MKLNPGTYEGFARGYRGKLYVNVTVSEDKILEVKITKHREYRGIAWGLNTTPMEHFPKLIVEYQSLNIPPVVGADVTSEAILGATAAALMAAGATEDDITFDIDPRTITVSGAEEDMANLTQLSIGSVDLSRVTGTNTFNFPISLDPSLENVSGETTASVTVTVEGLDTAVFEVDNISLTDPPAGYRAQAVTQARQVTVRGRAEDLALIDASQLRIVADVSNVTSTGQISVPARVYLNSAGSVGVIGEYTVVVEVSRR